MKSIISGSMIIVLGLMVMAMAQGDENLIGESLAKAKKEYQQELEDYNTAIVNHLDKLEEVARKAGDKKQVDSVKKMKVDYTENGVVPKSLPSVLKVKLNQGQAELLLAYKKSISEYVKAKKDTEAEEVEKEMLEFKKGGLVKGEVKKEKEPPQVPIVKVPQKQLMIDLGQGVKLEMVLIPAGKFMMGSAAKKGKKSDETEHEVILTKSFYMGKYEVTQNQWELVMGNNPSEVKGQKLPIMNLSWNDCQEFIKKLNENTTGFYRLPTEAEWEYSCRARTTTAYHFGDTIIPKNANYKDSNIGRSVAVGSYKPNAFGLYDMHGNVWEWCQDWYGTYPQGSATDPKGPDSGEVRVLRGGSFVQSISINRSSNRENNTPNFRISSLGFRLARTP